MTFRVLDLFSGIGAYSLGLERTGGFQTVAFCEIEDYPRRNLRKNWPHVHIHDDVRSLTGAGLGSAGLVPNWIVAGWPCQGNSPAGTGLGMDDPRSGLWSEIARLAGEIRPEGLLLENSSNLLSINGGADFGRVLGDLAALGYDAEWHCLPAAAFDAPHIRDRVWIIATLADAHAGQRSHAGQAIRAGRDAAHSSRSADADLEVQRRHPGRLREREAAQNAESGSACEDGPHADADSEGLAEREKDQRGTGGAGEVGQGRSTERMGALSDPEGIGRQPCRPQPAGEQRRPVFDGDSALANLDRFAPIGTAIARQERVSWEPEPDVVRVVHGAPDRVERIHALGNLNPPIIPEMIGRAILSSLGAA